VVIPTLVELRIVARGRTLIEGRPVIRKAVPAENYIRQY
jgi:hypothetical protein